MSYGSIPRTLRSGVPVVGMAMALVGAACGEVSNDPNGISSGGSSSAGRGGSSSAGRGGSAGRGSSSSGGSAGSAMVDAGAEGGAAGASIGGASMGGSSGSGQQLPADCPEINPIPVPGQEIVLRSLRFEPGLIVLQNVSDVPVTISGGRQGWQWCQFPAYWSVSETGNVVLSPGETLAVPMFYNASGIRDMEPDGGEMGIYTVPGSFREADEMRAFVSWGDVLSLREATAVEGGYWVFDERIEIGPNHAGFVIVGESNRAAGYQGVRAACLEPPPNEGE